METDEPDYIQTAFDLIGCEQLIVSEDLLAPRNRDYIS